MICIEYLEKHWGNHIFGYQIAAGQFGEWGYSWEGALSDFGIPQRAAYQSWLGKRYQDDEVLKAARYLDPELIETVALLRELSERLLESDRSPSAHVAVVVSKRSFSYLRQGEGLTNAAVGRQISEIAHSGIPFDTFFAEDLPLLMSKP